MHLSCRLVIVVDVAQTLPTHQTETDVGGRALLALCPCCLTRPIHIRRPWVVIGQATISCRLTNVTLLQCVSQQRKRNT